MRNKMIARGAWVFVAAAILGAERQASAQLACEEDSVFPNRVYISGSSALKPVFVALGLVLNQKAIPISIIYQSPDGCLALNDLLSSQASTEVPVTYPATAPSLPIFYGRGFSAQMSTTPPDQGVSCIPAVPPPPIDIAVSDVFYDTCAAAGVSLAALTGGQMDVLGPIEAMTFAAPILSTSRAISAEAAYVVFGYGAAQYVVEPWDRPSGIFARPLSSGVEAMIGASIGLASSLWQNAELPSPAGAVSCLPGEPVTDGCIPTQQEGSGPLMETALANVATSPSEPSLLSETIGVLSAQEVSQYNAASTDNKLKILAYQHTGQSCGYLPDSTASAKDKLNVRQGRYAIWGPLHLFVNVDGRGNPLPGNRDEKNTGKIAAITAILNYFIATGRNPQQVLLFQGPLDGTPPSGPDAGPGPGAAPPLVTDDDRIAISTAEAQASLVPWCAMQVLRTSEIGAEASYEPREPCSCFYAATVGAAVPDYCVTCVTSGDCLAPYPTCRLGYCEVQ